MTNTPRQEIPVDFDADPWMWGFSGSAVSPIQALMEAAPFEDPKESAQELQPLREAVADCIDMCSEQARFIIEAVDSERVSFRRLGPRLGLGKSQANLLYHQALAEMRAHCLNHPTIRERLGLINYWNHHAHQVLVRDIVDGHDGDNMWKLRMASAVQEAVNKVNAVLNGKVPESAMDSHRESINRSLRRAGKWAWRRLQAVNPDWGIADQIDMLVWKQSKYGHGNINKFGIVGVGIRVSDKMERVINLDGQDDGDMRDESMEDTLADIVGYAVIAQMLVDDTFNTELEPF